MSTTTAPLEILLDGFGYGPELRRPDVRPPGAESVLDLVAFTRVAPQDIRTSAIAAAYLRERPAVVVLGAARRMATPFALLADADTIYVYRIAATASDDEIVHRFDTARPDEWEVGKFRRALEPVALQTAKSGMRQLALFPIDVRLLQAARHQSIGSLSSRLESAFAHAHDTRRYRNTDVARMVVSALACVIVRDKYGRGARTATAMVESALQKHPSYFAHLAEWEVNDAATVERVLTELSEGLDYASVDARSVNSVYEQLFITPELRKELGIFYTDPQFASRILDSLPIEEVDPERRCVVDPACGSGNLLLAAQERLEVLAPGGWSAIQTHEWLKTHLVGADIDPIATELAKLSLLVSALPLGNTWQIETRDFLNDPPTLDSPPTLLVSNPPWQNPKGKQAETASKFLKGALDLLADGGFLACIMPVAWLSGRQHRASRRELSRRCELFEVWRLPRDMFAPEARMGCAVLFARKTRTPERRWLAFRWVSAGSEHRAGFIANGEPTFAAIVEPTSDGASFTCGPLDDFLRGREVTRLEDVAELRSGVVQRGVPSSGAPAKKRIPMLLRGAQPPIYRPLSASAITWADSLERFVATQAQVDALLVAPKLLIQADRFPDNPWRVRPVLDLVGVAPVGVWHAVVPATERDTYALLAILSTSLVSNWVHAHAASKRITLDLVGQIPLPTEWSALVLPLSRLGRQLARKGPTPDLLMEIEDVAAEGYQLRRRDRRAIQRMMAGYQAPEGTVRVARPSPRPKPPVHTTEPVESRAGTVLDIVRGRARVWTAGDDGDGELVDLPSHMPGWLCTPAPPSTWKATLSSVATRSSGRRSSATSSSSASSPMAHRGADVWFVDVGQGHATVAVCHGRAMVIDCPARGADDVVALLDEHGDDTDAIVVTHRDLDHCGGIRRVIDHHPPAVLYMNPSYALPPSGTEKMKVRTVLRGIFSAAYVHGVSVLPIHRGDSGTLADMDWDALAPTYRTVLDSSLTDATNRSSVVLRLAFDRRRVLITGDIDAAAIDALLTAGDDICAHVLLVPHHGAVIRGLDRLVDAVDPRIAVISAGRSAGTHPALPTLEGLAARENCRIMCTQVNRFCHAAVIGSPTCAGTIRIGLDTDEMTIEPSEADHDQRIDTFASPMCRQQN